VSNNTPYGDEIVPVTLNVAAIQTKTFKSTDSQDGWVLESSENSGVGGSMNWTDPTFNLGDDASNKQYRAILSFNTAALPNTLTIKSVTLKIKRSGLFGADPFKNLGALTVDIRKPTFGTSALQLGDFQAKPNKAAVGTFGKKPALDWYKSILESTSYAFINRTGLTQLRLRFATDDNNNMIADYMRFSSGDASLASRPTLIIEYTVP
jgi:hypothetical protein